VKKLFVVLMLIAALLLAGCGETVTPEKVDPDEPGEETGTPAAEKYVVGDTVKMGDLQFTLNGVRYEKGSEFWAPDEGTRWLVFDCTLENKGDESESISSLLMFTLYDSDSYKKDIAMADNLKGSLDGELGAGRKMAGEIAFTVDEDESAWEFVFEPQVFGFGQAIYDISASDIK
jgi:hypothetical protein